MKTALRLPPGLRFLPALLLLITAPALGQISATTYPFSASTGVALEDMSTGTTQLIGAAIDDNASAVTPIGFDFWFLNTRYAQFSVNANGHLRLGSAVISNQWDNASATTGFATAGDNPKVAPYFNDVWTGTNGQVHYKVVGVAPNRKLVVEWQNVGIPYGTGPGGPGAATFQAWLFETTGAIELLYGSGLVLDTDSGGASIGIANGAASFASVTTATDTVSYAAADNANTAAIPSGTAYLFTPPAVTAPTNLTFTSVTPSSMTLNWVDSPDESSYGVYMSTDGTNYSYYATTAAGVTTLLASPLTPSTTYFWKVVAVSSGAVSAPISGSQATPAAGTITSVASGLWSAPATWSSGSVPTSGDNVTIADGHTVTIDIAANAYSLTIGQGTSGSLLWEPTTARTLTVLSDLTIAAGATFASAASGTQTGHVLTVSGSLTNNGTLDFSTNTNTAGANIVFAGPTNATFGGTGATTHVRQITMNKGTSQASTLEMMPASFTPSTAGAAWLVTPIANGTFKISGSLTLSGPLFTAPAWTVNATGGLWLNNPNLTVTGQNGSPVINGLLRVSTGTLNIGTNTGNSAGFGAGSTVVVEGGVINVAGRFGVGAAANTISYTQTAGTITVCTQGNASGSLASFDMGTAPGSAALISGGTIVIQRSGTGAGGTAPRDYRCAAGGADLTGGTLQLGNSSSPAGQSFRLTDSVPNLSVEAGHTATWLGPVAFYMNALNVTIKTGATLVLYNGASNGRFYMFGDTLTNDGTLTANSAANDIRWYGTGGPATYTGSGVVTAPVTSLWVLTDLHFASTNPFIVNRVNLFEGNITGAGKLTLGNGGTTAATIQIGNGTTPSPAGTFDAAPTFNPGTGGEVIYYLRTSASRTTGFEINPTRALAAMTYDDDDPAHSVTIAGGDLAVTTAALTNGRVVTGANTFVIPSGGTLTRTAGYVDGNLRKTFTAAAATAFEVGTANGYSPVTFNATGGTFPADVTIKATQTSMPGILPASTALSRYWTITATGFTADLTFQYLDPTDIPGTATEASFKLFRHDGSGFTEITPFTLDTALNTASATGLTTFSDWSLAQQAAPQPTATVSGDATICNGASTDLSVALTGTGPWNLTWVDGYVQNGVAASPAIRTVSPSITSSYAIASVSDAFGPGTQSGMAIVTVNPIPGAPTLGSNTPLCAGSALNLTASSVSGATYSWTGPNGFTSSAQNPTIASAATGDSGTYSCTITVAGCVSAAATTDVVVNAIPATPTAGNNGPICEGATLNLTTPAVTGATYAWAGPNGFTSATQNPSIASATTAATGTYSVTVTASGCTSTAGTTSATVNAVPATPTAGNNGPICEGATLDLTTPAVTGATYAWTGPNGFTSATQNPSIASATTAATGTYSVIVTVSGCSSAAGTTLATVNAIPTAPTISGATSICTNSSLNLTASAGFSSYQWYLGGTPIGGATGATYTVASASAADSGAYTVTGTQLGCTSSQSPATTVTVAPCVAPLCPIKVLPNNGGTSGNERAPNPNFRYGRAVYLITAAEMAASGFASGADVTGIGWTFAAASAVGPASAPLVVYLQNTTDTTNTKSTTWATAITGMTTAHNASTTIPDTVGSYDLAFAGGSTFTYTGGGVYVAFDWGQYTGTLSTTSSILCTTSLAAGLKGAQSSASAPTTLASSNFRPETFLRPSTGPTNDASVDLVFSYGSLPQSLVGPQVVQAVVTNRGSNAITSLPVTLTVTGANSFTDMQTVATIAPCGGTATVTFAAYTPSATGSDTLTVTVPADDVPGNDSKAVGVNVTSSLYSYKYPGTTASGGVGVSGSTATFVAKFTTALATTVTAVNLEFAATSATTYRVAIYPDSGTGTPGTTPTYVDSADRTVAAAGPVTITLPSPVLVGPGSFFVGVEQTNTTNLSLSFDSEDPIRAGSFFIALPNPPATWLEFFADGDSFKLNIGITVTPCPSAPTVVPASRCGTGTVTLSATGAGAGQDYNWYAAASGGAPLFTGNPFTTPAIATTTTYYASIISTTPSCESGRTAVTATVDALPSTPTASSNGPVCEGATLNLTTPTVAGATYAWTGPNSFASATQNPSISSVTTAATGTYSVTITLGGCTSDAGTTSVTVNASTNPPTVTAPAPITVPQSLCCGTFGGASAATSAALNTFIGGGTATDDCDASPTKLTPQLGTTDVTPTTCFETGTRAVTFRFQDAAGHTGTADANVTVQMFGDLNLDNAVDPSDMVILRAYFNFAITPGTPPFIAPITIADLTHEGAVDPSDMVVLRAFFNFAVSCLAP